MDKKILTQSRLKEILSYDPDTGIWLWQINLNAIKIGDIAGCLCNVHKYHHIRINNKSYKAHRLVFLYMTGNIPFQVDHINHIRDDNRWVNLQPSSKLDNSRNQSKYRNNTSGYIGVHWVKHAKKWRAEIQINGSKKFLGYFVEKRKAVIARNKASHEYGFHKNHGLPSIEERL